MSPRCFVCKMKLKLVWQYKCKCGKYLCIQHRPSIEHRCSFDYLKENQQQLREKLPIVVQNKVETI